MNQKQCPTYWVEIALSGPLVVIEQTCRQFVLENPRCVTVEPTKFIYTGGEETGARIRFINYPRFPDTTENIREQARLLALRLLESTCQHSILIQDPQETVWLTKREL